MWGRATVTTVESRNAMPDPVTVANSTHRPRADESSSPPATSDRGGTRAYPASPDARRSATRRPSVVAHSEVGDPSGTSTCT